MHKVEKTVRKTIEENHLMEPGDHVILGFSGGPDSTCLFHILCKLRAEYEAAAAANSVKPEYAASVESAAGPGGAAERGGLEIRAIHVNHKIRPGDAEEDQKYVEDMCARAGVPERTVIFDAPKASAEQDLTEEEAGRDARYRAFREEAKALEEAGVPRRRIKIAVAHNADDQVETILFRMLIRGTGTDGLAGMDYRRSDESGFEIVRPLMDCFKADIEDYCREEGLEPRVDYTNGDTEYARNRVRLQMIPYLEEFNPNVKAAILRLGKTARLDRDYFDLESKALYASASGDSCQARLAAQGRVIATDAYTSPNDDTVITGNDDITTVNNEYGRIRLNGDVLRKTEKAVRLRTLRTAFKAAGFKEDFTFRHLESVDGILFSGKPSASIDLPHGFRARMIYGELEIAAPEAGTCGRQKARSTEPSSTLQAAPEKQSLPEGGSAEGGAGWGQRELTAREFFAEEKNLSKGEYAGFDAEKLEERFGKGFEALVSWRTRQAGDFIELPDGRHKRIKELFIDDKVPKDARDRVMMAAVGHEILFIPAGIFFRGRARYSAFGRVTEETKTVFIVVNIK
ncbi:MAG: tRNA lysidine(34) synthetase TilS [Eubacteriales bacterium]|nr:tRNA lysidine(34) synthetase TilS [Eubacteriales bacterium]